MRSGIGEGVKGRLQSLLQSEEEAVVAVAAMEREEEGADRFGKQRCFWF